jgi:NTE family protein
MKRALVLSGGGGRGAFQAGVLKYLSRQGWVPDLICGTSAGAINAAAMGSGLTADEIIHLWEFEAPGCISSVSPLRLLNLFKNRGVGPIMDPAPVRALLSRHLDIPAIRQGPVQIRITAVQVQTGRLVYFDQNEIDIDHVLASSAFPLFFPWQLIDGEPYWDGGIMDNIPIPPDLKNDVDQLIVVFPSPMGVFRLSLPKTFLQLAERVFEQALIGSLDKTILFQTLPTNERGFHIQIVAPTRMLGFYSLMNFSQRQARRFIAEGYQCAETQLQIDI